MTTLNSDRNHGKRSVVEREAVNDFINSYWVSTKEVDTFKQRNFFKKWLGRLGLLLFVISFVIASIIDIESQEYQIPAFITLASFVLGGLSILISSIYDIIQKKDDLDDESVACHDLAGAFRAYLQEDNPDVETIEYHLKEVQKHLRTPGILSPVNTKRISNAHREGINNYIGSFLEAADKEAELENTFPQFIELVSTSTALKTGSEIETLSHEINSAPTTKPS